MGEFAKRARCGWFIASFGWCKIHRRMGLVAGGVRFRGIGRASWRWFGVRCGWRIVLGFGNDSPVGRVS